MFYYLLVSRVQSACGRRFALLGRLGDGFIVGCDLWGGAVKKATEYTEGTEVGGARVGWWGCRAAFFDTFVKETESVWRMGAKQSVAYLRLFACICGYFFVIFILRIIITVILTADERGCTQMLWRGDWF